MRLHSLSVTAFGPFGGTVEVDFDQLGADGLFLLHGPTGAGKTSVLDAVAFALYGVLPGSRRENKRLLSDHAAPGVAPRVELEATLGGRRLTLVRHPEYLRPKLRGVGTTKQNAKATLTWHDGRSENLSRIDEIALEVERLLGMRVDQFFQVVLLPQGDFARFLRAKNEDRGALLEQLFDTDRFRDIETWFQERRRESAERLAGKSASLDRIAAQIASAAGEPLFVGTDVVEWATDLLDVARKDASTRSEELREARADHEVRRLAARDAHRRRDARDRGVAAQARLAALDASAAERVAMAAELDHARRADDVRRHAETAERERHRADLAATALTRAESAASRTDAASLLQVLSWPPAPTDPETLDAAVHRWSGECAVLDSVAADEADRAAAQRDRGRAVALVDTLTDELERLRARVAAVPAERLTLDAEHRDSVAAAASLESLEARHRSAVDAATAHVELVRCTDRLAAAVTEFDRLRESHAELRTAWLALRERRLDGIAAELAGELVDGQPCGVCGATEHPAPTSSGPDQVSKTDEDRALRRADEVEAHRVAAETVVHRLRREKDEVAARCADRSAAELTADLDEATTAVESARRSAGRLARLDAARDALDTEVHALHARIGTASAELAAAGERIASLDRRIAETTARIASAVGESGSAVARRTAVDAAIAATKTLRDARRDADAAHRSASSADADVAIVAERQGFGSAAEALAAVRDAARCTALEKALQEADRERSAQAAVLLEPVVVEAMSGDPVDVAPVDRAEEESRARVDAAVAADSDAEGRRRTLQGLVTELWAASDVLGPLRLEHRELENLADVVAGRGQNSRKMSLRSYVLAARLEDVATAASVRFRRMSEGRYEFVHSDEVGPRGTRGGLGLDVRDDYTGVVRSAGTLSGGEAFCASLSLALGLADVVAAEAGGVTLDTMFIDEGFGSLDAGSLDAVMGVLDELRSGGRTVGIVSHVDEIRDRVPSRLEVIRERHGSSVRVHAAV